MLSMPNLLNCSTTMGLTKLDTLYLALPKKPILGEGY